MPPSAAPAPRVPPRPTHEVTEELLSQYYHLPSEEACKAIGIGLTVLKRQCRKFGISRWPYRKIRSLDKVIQNVKAGLAKGEADEAVEALVTRKIQVRVRPRDADARAPSPRRRARRPPPRGPP